MLKSFRKVYSTRAGEFLITLESSNTGHTFAVRKSDAGSGELILSGRYRIDEGTAKIGALYEMRKYRGLRLGEKVGRAIKEHHKLSRKNCLTAGKTTRKYFLERGIVPVRGVRMKKRGVPAVGAQKRRRRRPV